MAMWRKILGSIVLIVAANAGIVDAANYTFTVNAGSKTGAWNRFYERGVTSCHAYTVIRSAYHRNISRALKIAHDSAGFQYLRCHGILDDDVAPYTSAGVYNWTNLDKIYDSVVAAGMKPAVEISFMPSALCGSGTGSFSLWYNGNTPKGGPPSSWANWRAFIIAFVQHLETRYGATEVRNNWLFEIWNEPDWMYTGWAPYLVLYDSTSRAIKAADSLVKIGGPACEGSWSSSAVATMIQHCKTANSKLDFISWHRYANDVLDAGVAGGVSKPSSISDYAKALNIVCANNGFTGLNICDEFGPTYNLDHRDNHTTASFLAKTVHLIALNGSSYPPPYMLDYWCISDMYEEFNGTGQTAYRSAGQYGLLLSGDSAISQSWDVAKPAFNAYKMLHKLGDTVLTSSGGTMGDGANLIATINKTKDTVTILTYSHYDGGATTQATDNVSLTVSNIPFTHMKIEHWIVDSTHGNSFYAWRTLGGPANPTAAQWTTIAAAAQLAHYDSVKTDTTVTSGTYAKTFTQNYYSVGLIQLTKIGASKVSEPLNMKSPSVEKLTANIVGGKLHVSFPSIGQYTVLLFTLNGKKIRDFGPVATGKAAFAFDNLGNGAYMLNCTGKSGTLVMPVLVGR